MTEEAAFGSLGDLEERARQRTPADLWAYVAGGSAEERTVAANREAFGRRWLRPRVLRGVESVDLRTELLGRRVAVPWYLCPTAYHGDLLPEGEVATARAAASAGCLAGFSTLSSFSLEEIAGSAPGSPRWFQLYLQPEFEASAELVRRAERAAYDAIALTVDVPLLGVRDRQASGGFAIRTPRPAGNGPTLSSPAREPLPGPPPRRLRADAAATWEMIDRLRAVTSLPLLVKGILRGDDARRAVEHGARGVIVSNHGGRQLDGALAALDALPEVVEAVGGRAEVYLEGGVRRGSDVLIALALGAHGVGLGRPPLWALLAGGEEGLRRYLGLLEEEFLNVMALAGCRSLSEIDRDLVV